MTILATKLLDGNTGLNRAWSTTLSASDTTAKERPGSVRYTVDSKWGLRGFKYVRFDQSGGVTTGQLQSQVANTAIANITAGTTKSITTTGLTAGNLVGGLLVCTDNDDSAGAAPEGESGIITANSTTVVEIDLDDAFSVAAAVNDDFEVLLPFAVDDAAAADSAGRVQGIVMADHIQFNFGWVQFYGLNPSVDAIAAGTALPVDEGAIAGAALVTDGAGAANNLQVGVIKVGLTIDTILRKAVIDLYCGDAFKIGIVSTI